MTTSKKTFAEELNWYGLVAEGVVLCKDGSLLAGWHLRGTDTESLALDVIDGRTTAFARSIAEFKTGEAFWIDLARRPLRTYATNERDFPVPVLQDLERERADYFRQRGDENYANALTLVYQWQPPAGPASVEEAIDAFKERCWSVEGRFGSLYRLKRMGLIEAEIDHHGSRVQFDELVGRLSSGISGRFRRVSVPQIPVYLDVILAPEWEHETPRLLPMVSGRPAAFIAIDGYPSESSPEMLAMLEQLAFEYQWTTRFMPLSGNSARNEIGKRVRAWGQGKTSLQGQLSRNGAGVVSSFTASMEAEAQEALSDVDSGDLRYGFFNTTLAIFGDIGDEETAVRRRANAVIEALGELGYGARLETYNAFEAFLSVLPGHRKENVRRGVLSAKNFADLIPIGSVWAGEPQNPCNKFPAGSPALLRARSRTGEPYFFNLHSKDVGHTLIFGPTGAGKSVLLGLIASNFLKYSGAQVFAFDKGRSMQALCLAVGGEHHLLGEEGAGLAPMRAIGTLGRSWAEEWMQTLVRLGGVELTPARRREITSALAIFGGVEGDGMATFATMVQDDDVKGALAPYLTGGAYDGLLNATEDSIRLAGFTVFETEKLFEVNEAIGLLTIDYLFRMIDKRLDGRPTLIMLDEAWSYLGHDVFRARIKQWLRELRKRNASVVIATQFIGDAVNSELSGALLQSCRTRIFLPDPAAKSRESLAFYQALGLAEAQIDLVAGMQEKRDYYVIKPEGRRIVDFAIQPRALALLGATDAEDSALALEMARSGDGQWWRNFIDRRVTTHG
ncbi:hypothetical protein [Solirhodobacter olei]|uniref:TraG/VirB4 family ATPase n=1 Tax=Solirhodobacter olei TaxID=2493082 RepID=UPI000FD8BC81|nr:hypothetical protein [Solirhodobacter olei]